MNPLKREFIELAKRSGWSQAEIGRRLELSRGGVNGIITGEENPSRAMVKLFQYVLTAEKPELLSGPLYAHDRTVSYGAGAAAPAPGAEYAELLEKLDALKPADRADLLEHFTGMAEMMRRKTKAKKNS